MMPIVLFPKSPSKKSGAAIIPVFENAKPGKEIQNLDKASGGLIEYALETAENFKGKHGQAVSLLLPKSAPYKRVVLLGLGKSGDADSLAIEEAGGKAAPVLMGLGAEHVSLLADAQGANGKASLSEERVARLLMGIRLRSYQFERYKSPKSNGDAPKTLAKIEVISARTKKIEAFYKSLEPVIDGVFTARDFVNEPPNMLYPEAYAKRIRDLLKPLGVEVDILDEKALQKHKMGGVLAVGMGSAHKPRVVVMRWNGLGKKTAKPLALVGKGVTFDTGGISIKPGAGMEEMKMDMAGSAAVVGALQALAARKSKSHVVGIVGLAENMPGDAAYRPADIITSHSGKTIEVLNTDAEGRLILADILTYVQKTYAPHTIIDLATLTGAMMVALGYEYCGTFANDDKLWKSLEKASATTGEKLWRMPLDEVWKKDMEGTITDLQNLGKSGRYAGACTAAGFLEHFIENGTPWAHLDIAGTAWIKKDRATVPKNGTGFGVRVLEQLVADKFEG